MENGSLLQVLRHHGNSLEFYGRNSSYVHGGLDGSGKPEEAVYGQAEIHKKVMSLQFSECHTKIRHVDAHATLGDGVVVQVMGELSNRGQPMRRFMQTFVLAPEQCLMFYSNGMEEQQEEAGPEVEPEPQSESEANQEVEADLSAEGEFQPEEVEPDVEEKVPEEVEEKPPTPVSAPTPPPQTPEPPKMALQVRPKVGSLTLDFGPVVATLKEARLKDAGLFVTQTVISSFGTVVEMRINTKGVGGKLPNFGFVVFDDSDPVQRILAAKPVMFRGEVSSERGREENSRKLAPFVSVKPEPPETVAVETVVPGASWVTEWGETETGEAHRRPPPDPPLVQAVVAERVVSLFGKVTGY
ncbi:Ras GTPase-activating protein-binding protein 2 [Bagarius yarrelli]|uniref:Ras GTPase-activating protein-binding protein 2 n=1 Tax=Bagarius yarrelli TaxID=175774 RepID=A0A556VWS7_BAGYA|nr:Ras GTPase-activating protein-binding protein 2 [Bagarius yarrelli]